MSGENVWREDGTLVIPSVPATAVYNNELGDIVIAQAENGEKRYVRIPIMFARVLISAIERELAGAEAMGGGEG